MKGPVGGALLKLEADWPEPSVSWEGKGGLTQFGVDTCWVGLGTLGAELLGLLETPLLFGLVLTFCLIKTAEEENEAEGACPGNHTGGLGVGRRTLLLWVGWFLDVILWSGPRFTRFVRSEICWLIKLNIEWRIWFRTVGVLVASGWGVWKLYF